MSSDSDRILHLAWAILALGLVVTCGGRGRIVSAPAAAPAPRAVAPAPSADAGAVSSRKPETDVAARTASDEKAAPEALHFPRLYAALGALEAKTAKQSVRVLWLGDSHTAADFLSGSVRSVLAERFGWGGPGYLRLGVGIYRHGCASVTRDGPWKTEPNPPSRRTLQDNGIFGLGGMRANAEPHAHAHVEVKPSTVRGDVRYELLFDADAGAKVSYSVATRTRETLDAKSGSDAGDKIRRVSFTAQSSEAIDINVLAGTARFYGLIAEAAEPGFVLDTLGIDGARVATPLSWDQASFETEVASRKPDLLVLAYGTNEAFDSGNVERYATQIGELVGRVRRGAPGVECLILGPPDAIDATGGSPARLTDIERVQHDAAVQLGCGYFSLRAAMGGPGSFETWLREDPPLARSDHLHFTHQGYEKMGGALSDAILAAYAKR